MSQTLPAPSCMFRHHQRGTLGGLAMKKFLLGSVGLAAMLAGPAIAADMPIKAPPPPPVAYYDWSGAYIGFNAGGIWNETNRNFLVGGAVNPNFSTNDSDGVLGFHAARNGSGAPGFSVPKRHLADASRSV